MTTAHPPRCLFPWSKSLSLLVFALLLPVTSTFGIGLPGSGVNVTYTPNTTQSVQGDEPLHYQYTLTVTSPGVITGATTISLVTTVISAPSGVSNATASSFVTYSSPQLTFSGPNVGVQVVVHVDVPNDAGASIGDFAYKISTAGWPTGLGIVDNGTFINMHVSPPSGLQPPTVAITSPADGSSYTYTLGGPPVQVPVTVVGVADASAPVLAMTADLSGTDTNGDPIPDTPIAITLAGLGSPSAQGLATLPITVPGQYTITATATNSIGSSVTSSDFTVDEYIPPPTVTINPPAGETHTYIRGLTSTSVPYSFTGTSLQGGIQTLTATLDGNPLTPDSLTGIGQLSATGSGSLTFDASTVNGVGEHTIVVTATDPNGSASASATFVIDEQVPTISCTIATPTDGATFPLPPDGSPLNIPFNFSSTATLGAPVTEIAATLTDSNGTNSVTLSSTSGLNTPTASGAGTLTNVTPGTYTLGATGTNTALDLSAFDSATITVAPPPPPTIAYTQAPSSTYTALTGYPVSIPFAFQTTGTGAYIKTQRATLDGVDVTLTANTANGTALTATGGATLSVPSPTAGTSTHTLIVYGTDVYNGVYSSEVSAVVTFSVTVTDPVITIAINPEVAGNSPYTMPATGSLTIPFTFTGNITQGATVDAISGTLNGVAVTITSYTGLGTAATATGSGTLTISQSGTYTLAATDKNNPSGLTANTSVSFVVNPAASKPPLTIAITQAPQASYTLINGAGSLSIPITFVGKSNNGNAGGKVSTMSATLDGNAVSLSSTTGLGTPTATSTATLSISTAGTHVLVVKDTDPYSQVATASATFNVVVQNPLITIVVNNPANNAVFTLPCGGGCGSYPTLSIPFSLTANITSPATIDVLSATLNGCAVTVTPSGLGTSSATGTGTIKVSSAGTYTLTFKATDKSPTPSGVTATASVTFTVKKPGPPTVSIASPTQTSFTAYCLTCGGMSIPFSFNATSQCGGVSKLSATLDGKCVSVTVSGLGTANATGSGTMAVKSAGTHKLTVMASDANGSASTSFTFTLTSVTPTPTVTITQPADGATFTYSDKAPSIPFSISASTNSGATISSIKATLNGNCVNVSTNGIGSNAATGSGNLSICGAGTYTLSVTATSCGVNATAKVSFTVVQDKPKCSLNWLGSISLGDAKHGGSEVPCKFQVKRSYRDGSCDVLDDSSVKISCYEIYRDGSCSQPTIYSRKTNTYSSWGWSSWSWSGWGWNNSSYDIDSNHVYNVDLPTSWGKHRYHVDVYYFPNGGTTPCTLGSKEFSTH